MTGNFSSPSKNAYSRCGMVAVLGSYLGRLKLDHSSRARNESAFSIRESHCPRKEVRVGEAVRNNRLRIRTVYLRFGSKLNVMASLPTRREEQDLSRQNKAEINARYPRSANALLVVDPRKIRMESRNRPGSPSFLWNNYRILVNPRLGLALSSNCAIITFNRLRNYGWISVSQRLDDSTEVCRIVVVDVYGLENEIAKVAIFLLVGLGEGDGLVLEKGWVNGRRVSCDGGGIEEVGGKQ
ncbi:hypothetical protein Tco_0008934 [Tanacetum coccineum]